VIIMSDNRGPASGRDVVLENIAAEMTSVVYPLVLRHGLKCSWLDMELDLWRALTLSVKGKKERGEMGTPFA
jgi:hypothetical protein